MLARLARLVVVAVAVPLVGCSQPPTAKVVCGKLEAAGIAKNCHEVKPEMLSARAASRIDFDLVSVPGKGGAVMDFAKDEDLEATVKAYEAAAMLAGPHRYSNQKARIFLQLNTEASLEEGKRAKALIEAL